MTIVVSPEARGQLTGAGIFDSTASLAKAIEDRDWVDGVLSGVALGFDVAATVSDPLGSLFAAGIGWLIDHLEPIKGWFDDLAGNPEGVKAHAGTMLNVSAYLAEIKYELESGAEAKIGQMKGKDVEAYRRRVAEQAQALSVLSGSARGISVGLEGAAMLVGFVHALLRDALSQIVGAILSYLAELAITLGLATPLVIEQATTRVSALAAEVVPKVKGLKNSVTDLGSLQSALRDILNDIPRFLGSRYSVPNHPNLHWRDVVNQDLPSLNWLKGQAGTGWNVKDLFRWTAERDGHEIIQWMRTADPKLLDKAITDAFKDGVPQNLADAGKALKDAIERQMKGRA